MTTVDGAGGFAIGSEGPRARNAHPTTPLQAFYQIKRETTTRLTLIAPREASHRGPRFFLVAHEKGLPEGSPWSSGADNGIRTRDPHLGKVVLYQLSHVRVATIYISGTSRPAQELFSKT